MPVDAMWAFERKLREIPGRTLKRRRKLESCDQSVSRMSMDPVRHKRHG